MLMSVKLLSKQSSTLRMDSGSQGTWWHRAQAAEDVTTLQLWSFKQGLLQVGPHSTWKGSSHENTTVLFTEPERDGPLAQCFL
jgi:hypothetical protein